MVRKIDAPGLSWVRVSRSSVISAFLGISLGVVITSTQCYSGPFTDAVKKLPSSQPLDFFIVFVLCIAASCLAFRSSPRRHSDDLPAIMLRRYFSGHPLPMILFDVKTTNILAANRAACALYGYTSKELRGMSMDSVHLAQGAVAFRRKLDEISMAFNAAGSAGDWTHLRKDGTELTVNVSGAH